MPRRRDARGLLFCVGWVLGCASCAVSSPSVSPLSPSSAGPPANALEFPDDAGLARYFSKRLKVSLPLPRGSEWSIDDHSLASLVATHAPTQSRVLVGVLFSDANVGRSECEAMAREQKLVPTGPYQTLDDEVDVTQLSFDTRIEVALITGDGPTRPLIGHVMAFGGFLRKCYVFDFATAVPNADGAALLSSRLALARARILGGLIVYSGLTLDSANSGPSPPAFPVTKANAPQAH